MDTFKQFLAAQGLPANLEVDGTIHRFGKNLCQWFIASKLSIDDKTLITVKWGDWREGITNEWTSDEELKHDPKVAEQLKLQEEKAQAEKLERYETIAKEATTFWNALPPATTCTPYQASKGITKYYKARAQGKNLLMPLQDLDGKLWGYQTISVGFKQFLPGMKVRGSFSLFGSLQANNIYLCEGWATGASIWEALGSGANKDVCLLACCNANNMVKVSEDIDDKLANKRVFVCADNDAFTTIKGKPVNPGLEAAKQCHHSGYTYPIFDQKYNDQAPTDFNDLHALQGLDEVTKQIRLNRAKGEGDTTLSDSAGAPTKPKKEKLPAEREIVDVFVKAMKHDLLVSERDIFRWKDTHWHLLTKKGHADLYRTIDNLYQGKASHTKNKATLERAIMHLHHVPGDVNIYEAPPLCTNFSNGTLHMTPRTELEQADDKGEFDLQFKPHNKYDYFTTVIPLDYDPDAPKNDQFHAMLGRVLGEGEDADQKLRAIRQMFGACLIGYYPRIFMALGGAGTGKSSVITCAQNLIHSTNFSSVEPQHMRGAELASVIGKNANICTDISSRNLNDSALKRVEDRGKITVNLKWRQPVSVSLPPTHIYCANTMPLTNEESDAWERRITLLYFDQNVIGKGPKHKDFGNWVFSQGPADIVNFAIEGLRDIIQLGGIYTQPDSGTAQMKTWKSDNASIYSDYICALGEGHVDDQGMEFKLDPEASIRRSVLWKSFTKWADEVRPGDRVKQKHLFSALSRKFESFRDRPDRNWCFKGISGDATHSRMD